MITDTPAVASGPAAVDVALLLLVSLLLFLVFCDVLGTSAGNDIPSVVDTPSILGVSIDICIPSDVCIPSVASVPAVHA
jgi:hypothetical protein